MGGALVFLKKLMCFAALGAGLQLAACASPGPMAWLEDVPEEEFDRAVRYMQMRLHEIENHDLITIIDYSKHSSEERMYVINLREQTVTKYRVAHGAGSDQNHDGWIDAFGNEPGSKMSPNGFFKVAEQYEGAHGDSLRMDGLGIENRNARDRAIVIHGAAYMSPLMIERWTKPGRSWGCPAVYGEDMETLYSQLPGSLLYIMDRLPSDDIIRAAAKSRDRDRVRVASRPNETDS